MKKIIYLFALISAGAFAQEHQKDVVTVSVNYNFSEPTQYGVSLEFTKEAKVDERLTSQIFNVSYGQLEYDNNYLKTTGNGFVIELGSRTYFKKGVREGDRKSTRLNSSHVKISYAVF